MKKYKLTYTQLLGAISYCIEGCYSVVEENLIKDNTKYMFTIPKEFLNDIKEYGYDELEQDMIAYLDDNSKSLIELIKEIKIPEDDRYVEITSNDFLQLIIAYGLEKETYDTLFKLPKDLLKEIYKINKGILIEFFNDDIILYFCDSNGELYDIVDKEFVKESLCESIINYNNTSESFIFDFSIDIRDKYKFIEKLIYELHEEGKVTDYMWQILYENYFCFSKNFRKYLEEIIDKYNIKTREIL